LNNKFLKKVLPTQKQAKSNAYQSHVVSVSFSMTAILFHVFSAMQFCFIFTFFSFISMIHF